jgi:hypothetical protein
MSNDARSELFLFIAVTFATAIGLFVLSKWYASYFDVQHHAKLAQGGPYDSVVTAREEDQKALAGGKLPIDQAMQRLAQRGRVGFGAISPAPSDDLSALSGWIRHPAYKAVAAHPVRTPRASKPVPAPPQPPSPPQPPQAAAAPAAPTSPAAQPAKPTPAPQKRAR